MKYFAYWLQKYMVAIENNWSIFSNESKIEYQTRQQNAK